MKHVGGLRRPRDQVAIGDDERRVTEVGVGQKLERRRIRIGGGAALDRLERALRGDALAIGRLLEGADVSRSGEARIIAADQTIKQMDARHGLVPPGDVSSNRACRLYCMARSARSSRKDDRGIAPRPSQVAGRANDHTLMRRWRWA